MKKETLVTFSQNPPAATENLPRRGRMVRAAVTVVATALLVAGTVWGQDDHFPFGPFRMYSTTRGPDAPAIDTRVEAVDMSGTTLLLTPGNTGIRRAEFEGQLDRFADDPTLLEAASDAYARRNPDAPALREVRIVIRWHEIRDFAPTGVWRDEVVASWQP